MSTQKSGTLAIAKTESLKKWNFGNCQKLVPEKVTFWKLSKLSPRKSGITTGILTTVQSESLVSLEGSANTGTFISSYMYFLAKIVIILGKDTIAVLIAISTIEDVHIILIGKRFNRISCW